jgi:hypothetical protein
MGFSVLLVGLQRARRDELDLDPAHGPSPFKQQQ